MRKLTPRQRDVLRIIADAGHEGTVLNKVDCKIADRLHNRWLYNFEPPYEPQLLKCHQAPMKSRLRLVWVITECGEVASYTGVYDYLNVGNSLRKELEIITRLRQNECGGESVRRPTHCYVVRCENAQCGGWVTAISDLPAMAGDIAREVHRAVRAGRTVERMTVEAFRSETGGRACSCNSGREQTKEGQK